MKLAKITATVFLTAILLAGCSCQHEWVEANCITPKTCSKCGETEGEALGHSWAEADCTAPKTCTRCGETEGEALGHDMVGATYQTPATCSRCGAEGEKLEAYFEKNGWLCADENNVLSSGAPSDEDGFAYAGGYAQRNQISRFTSDSSHPAKEGYEWIKVSPDISLTEEEYNNGTGFTIYGWGDYYLDEAEMQLDEESGTFCVNWQGEEYADCSAEMVAVRSGWGLIGRTYETAVRHWEIELDCYFQVPVGYDGIVIFAAELTPEEQEKCNSETEELTDAEILDGNVALFRLDE